MEPVNTALWVTQILLALAFGMAGWLKASKPKAELEEKLTWMQDFPQSTIRIIGLVELLGAAGLVLPAASGLFPILTPLAASGLAIIMILAIGVHARRKEAQAIVINVVLLALLLFVAWGRFGAYAI